ncbi:MAG TPA: hypothetical protein VIX83_06235 [Candidatus Cybelea sp.]
MMKNLKVAALLAGLTAMALCRPALAADHDGQLPLYPHGAPAHGLGDIPSNALTQGVPYQQTTNDSVQTVDQWYKANAPKSCSRIAGSGAVQYKCSGGSIVIQNHDGTIISFVPAFPHF